MALLSLHVMFGDPRADTKPNKTSTSNIYHSTSEKLRKKNIISVGVKNN
jgi:hypothetical protein